MRRFLSVWLRHWPTDRFRRQSANKKQPTDKPLVLTAPGNGGPRLFAVDARAASLGLYRDQTLADARARVPELQAVPADPMADAAALGRLADWCRRYAPWAAGDGDDGLILEITGCAHLFAGEAALLTDLAQRLAKGGTDAHLAIADTPGAAWAWARFGDTALLPSGEAHAKLRKLPIQALRLPPEIADGLWRLGLRSIGHLIDLPRGPLARRFGPETLQRLDRVLGVDSEPIDPRRPAPHWRVRLSFPDGIGRREDIDAALKHLLATIATTLEREQLGVRRLELGFYRLDGSAQVIAIGTSQPTREAKHLRRLFAEKLDSVDPGFGIETMMLEAYVTETLVPRQAGLSTAPDVAANMAAVIDRLQNRLGRRAVYRAALQESHSPERAVAPARALARTRAVAPATRPRPLRLFSQPERIDARVLAGPAPHAFRWRRVEHRVTASRGPERLEPEWWRGVPLDESRDYFWLQDGEGRRFWVYRARTEWFLHGLFA